jgi:hypothetical protein
VTLTTYPHLALRLKKERSYTSTLLCAFLACYRVTLTFIYTDKSSVKYNEHGRHRKCLQIFGWETGYGRVTSEDLALLYLQNVVGGVDLIYMAGNTCAM